jgi:hypothetical protein
VVLPENVICWPATNDAGIGVIETERFTAASEGTASKDRIKVTAMNRTDLLRRERIMTSIR